MTYPPRQPGPGGWDHLHGTGQSGSDQQQPGWYGNRHTQWGQQPGQEPPPGHPLQPGQQGPPPGQSPQQGQQGPPPPDWTGSAFAEPGFGREPYGFGDVEEPKRRSRLPWLLGGLGVVVVAAGAITAFLLLFSGPDSSGSDSSGPGDPRPTVRTVVAKVNAGKLDALGGQLCASNRARLEKQLGLLEAGEFDIRIGGITTSGDTATARLEGTYSLGGASQPVDQTIGLVVEDGRWKVCDLAT